MGLVTFRGRVFVPGKQTYNPVFDVLSIVSEMPGDRVVAAGLSNGDRHVEMKSLEHEYSKSERA
jgi:hypothetical protein